MLPCKLHHNRPLYSYLGHLKNLRSYHSNHDNSHQSFIGCLVNKKLCVKRFCSPLLGNPCYISTFRPVVLPINAGSCLSTFRPPSTYQSRKDKKLQDGLMYMVSIIMFMVGVSFAAVPLYKMYCSSTGYGGTTQRHNEEDTEKVATMEPVDWRPIHVHFSGVTSSDLDWDFYPVQKTVRLVPGETCLAFFTAKNNSDRAITGISTYNVTPFEAGAYFNKIQCFCFDEQTLNPGEELDMPVFFYIDPDFALDADLIRTHCKDVSLHYTFFDTAQSNANTVAPIVTLAKTHLIPAVFGKQAEDPSEETPDTGFQIPEGVVKINNLVYKHVVRKGYDKEFVEKGTTVVAHVKGMIKETGKVFWSTKNTGQKPFVYKAGVGQVISGWDEGCLGMSEGEISRITIASSNAYGTKGNPTWDIPGNTDLTFEIEILSVK